MAVARQCPSSDHVDIPADANATGTIFYAVRAEIQAEQRELVDWIE
jgi:hypothetical protein